MGRPEPQQDGQITPAKLVGKIDGARSAMRTTLRSGKTFVRSGAIVVSAMLSPPGPVEVSTKASEVGGVGSGPTGNAASVVPSLPQAAAVRASAADNVTVRPTEPRPERGRRILSMEACNTRSVYRIPSIQIRFPNLNKW